MLAYFAKNVNVIKKFDNIDTFFQCFKTFSLLPMLRTNKTALDWTENTCQGKTR
jgi:hypothetical protein